MGEAEVGADRRRTRHSGFTEHSLMTRRTKAAALAFLLSTAWAQQPPPPAPAQTQPAQPPVAAVGGFNLNNAPLLQVIDDLARELKINYVLDASIRNGSVTVNTFG